MNINKKKYIIKNISNKNNYLSQTDKEEKIYNEDKNNQEKLLNKIINCKINIFNKNTKYVALLIESKIYKNSEFLLRQFSRFLPIDFSILIYVTKHVYSEYIDLVDKINNNIIIKLLPSQYKFESNDDYNKIMLNISFWKMLNNYEKVLVFKIDTMIYRQGIEEFYEYDYIGAPWDPNSNINLDGGNGSFSLRNIKKIIYCLEHYNEVNTHDRNKDTITEDLFFSFAMNQFGFKLPDKKTASYFSIESYLYNEKSIGSHELYKHNNELHNKLLLNSINEFNYIIKYDEIIEYVRKYKLIKFNNNSKNIAIMIESRIFNYTELLLRQFSRFLNNDFTMWIYVTENVYDEYINLASKLDNNINILILPKEYILRSRKDYNKIMLNINFWKLLIKFDKALIFQHDTMIFHNEIDQFYDYDYIGAPWDPINNIDYEGGNGGFSLRNIKAIIYSLEYKSFVKMHNYDINTISEDIFFSIALKQFGYKLPTKEISSLFSIESYLYNEFSLGCHKLDNKNLFNKLLLKSISNVIIYILCYSEETYNKAISIYKKYNWAKPIIIKNQDYTFENAFWKQLLDIKDEWSNLDMVGILSWKAYKKKDIIDLELINKIILNKEYIGKDYIHFCDTNTLVNNSLNILSHTHFKDIWNYILNELKIKDFTESICNYFMSVPHKMLGFINWYVNILLPLLLNHPLIFEDANHNGDISKEDLIKLWDRPYYPHLPFILERLNKAYFIYDLDKINYPINSNNLYQITNINLYPTLFNKYILNITNINEPIKYDIIQKINISDYICHIHIHDISKINDYIKYIYIIINEFTVIITFNDGILSDEYLNNNIMFIKIKNKGYDIGPKISVLEYLYNNSIDYKYILFLHSKTDEIMRKKYFTTFAKNNNRIKLIKYLLMNNNLLGIFLNEMHINERKCFQNNNKYYNEILEFLKISSKDKIFSEGNCMILHKNVLDYIFKSKYKLFYNLLNDNSSFDYNWFTIYYNLNLSGNNAYSYYLKNKLFGNNFMIDNLSKSLPDGMIEHIFERIWLNVIIHLKGDYLILDEKNLYNFYDIKINAIYFPQFHRIPENDKFWGNNFTEWTFLKPFNKVIKYNNEDVNILKPHEYIGYYDLNNKNTLIKQIKLANKYNINGFVIYHYWFNKNKILLHKPLEYFLDEKITFPFSISWANETWSRKWDGSNEDILIFQDYNDHLEHIQYLIPFFKRPNYIKNMYNECIFYIYNASQIDNFKEMKELWINELNKHNIKIKIIITENGNKENHNIYNDMTKFIFEPMYSTNYCNQTNFEYKTVYNYDDIINKYKNNEYNTENKHLGLSLYWNNCVRKKNLYLEISNFSHDNLKNMLIILLSKIIYKYKNIYDLSKLTLNENIIIVNAWNEWNEQAMLEPNNITGYYNLQIINNIISDL